MCMHLELQARRRRKTEERGRGPESIVACHQLKWGDAGMPDHTESLLSQQNIWHCDVTEEVRIVGCGGNWYTVHFLLKTKCNCSHPVNAESQSLIPTQLILLFSHALSEFLYLIRCQSIYLSVKSRVNSQIQGQMKLA